MKVVSFDANKKAQARQDLLDVLEEIRSQIEDGTISELVATSISVDGEPQIHVMTRDFIGAVGLFEIGKNMLISTISYDE